MRKSLLLAGALLLVLAGDAVAGPLEDGLAAYKQRNYITAYGALYPLAEEGNASAQNLVGVMILKGMVGKEPDPDLALSWFSKAADNSTAQADVHDNAVYNRDFLTRKLKEREASPSIVAGPIEQSKPGDFLRANRRLSED